MGSAKKREWYVLIQDDDQKTAGIAGPVEDDSNWIEMICREREKGRNLRFQSVQPEQRAEIEPWLRRQGFRLVETRDILEPPPDRSAEYQGPLPEYAKKTPRSRLIKISCRSGKCPGRQSAWAEMNMDFPGFDVLKRAEPGDFRARCLRCGYEASDNYNWMRWLVVEKMRLRASAGIFLLEAV